MLVAVTKALLCLLLYLLPSQVNALISTDAKCLSGYEWMFSSTGQSPCDVAAELASVCTGRPFNLFPLIVGYTYTGPTVDQQNNCRCSSVYYSLLSSCGYCQGRNYRRWSAYNTNCTTVNVLTEPIPIGVKVPDYAYQDVSISDMFNVTLAYTMRGAESSRSPATPTSSQRSDSSISATSDSSNGGGDGNTSQVTGSSRPAIVGGIVGGLIGLGLIVALIACLILRSKRKEKSQNNPGIQQQNSNMALSPNATLIQSMSSPPPGSPASRFVYNPDEQIQQNTYPFVDSDIHDPYRQHSQPLILNNFTGISSHGLSPLSIPQNPAALHHGGRPEL